MTFSCFAFCRTASVIPLGPDILPGDCAAEQDKRAANCAEDERRQRIGGAGTHRLLELAIMPGPREPTSQLASTARATRMLPKDARSLGSWVRVACSDTNGI